MNYQQIRKFDTANGTGIRVNLFVSGCSFSCKGCFNHEAWKYDSGKPFTVESLEELLTACDSDFISGLSILGGEPLEPRNVEQVAYIAGCFKTRFPEKSLWLWTGFTLDSLIWRMALCAKGSDATESILTDVDVLIDGQYEKDNPTSKPYRGSDNQRMWVKNTGHFNWKEVTGDLPD
ncbi:ribonucleotide reductase of class III, small subunit [Pectobacterium phage Arno162]|uniref:Anaerobic ribonucleoside-triphosphate reductase-activating protein n=2 Tax=Arnovirus TaxID=3425109 RepID=A0A678ZKB3_9CAUD|nr:ribonucleotide reductase of class III, small subunit [Pectobacterium phage Arno162]AZV02324.1 ribonucleotide reductase of class III, small subunit [Pectobacterium phage Arno18]